MGTEGIETVAAIRTARKLLGTPYSEMDCINLIKAVIRKSPGGVENYTTAGTNALWNSFEAVKKYRDLLERRRGIHGAQAGMLAFKIRERPNGGEDIHHVGLVTDVGTVIHASGPTGPYRRVVETRLDGVWNALGVHRYIQVKQAGEEGGKAVLYRARVATQADALRVRAEPETGEILGHVERGSVVDVLEAGRWPRIRADGLTGYASAAYLDRLEEVPGEQKESFPAATTLIERKTGQQIQLLGDWRRAED